MITALCNQVNLTIKAYTTGVARQLLALPLHLSTYKKMKIKKSKETCKQVTVMPKKKTNQFTRLLAC